MPFIFKNLKKKILGRDTAALPRSHSQREGEIPSRTWPRLRRRRSTLGPVSQILNTPLSRMRRRGRCALHRSCAKSVSTRQAAQSTAAPATVPTRSLRQPVGRGNPSRDAFPLVIMTRIRMISHEHPSSLSSRRSHCQL